MKYFHKYIENNNNLSKKNKFSFNFPNKHSTSITSMKKINSEHIYIQKYTTTLRAKNITKGMCLWKLTLIYKLLIFTSKKYSIKF